MRRQMMYSLTGLLLLVNAGLVVALVDTNNDQTTIGDSLLIGCERANRRADAGYWGVQQLVERARLEGDQEMFRTGTRKLVALTLTPREKPRPGRPWLVDCEAAYP